MNVAILLFDGITALDCVGPSDVLAHVPGLDVTFVGKDTTAKRVDTGVLALLPDKALAEFPNPDIVLVPGGPGTQLLMEDKAVLDWIRTAHETSTWTMSVCTGALVLGAAGLLDRKRATTAWVELPLLETFGATVVEERYVRDGKLLTTAGVTAGIDGALYLAAQIAGTEVAKTIQLALQYDPEPPFDCGSPRKASPELIERARTGISYSDARAIERISEPFSCAQQNRR